jgi:precorrin-2 dehydrogenase/sirohydrochlorin ferrochelatase
MPPPTLLPISLRVKGLPCLVVGGGRVAARKVASLLECGAEVTVIAPEICAEIDQLSSRQIRRAYREGDAERYRLVITATGRPDVDRAVFRDGEATGVLVNAADDPDACRFYLPSLFRRGPVTIAVSTAGTSPFLAKWLGRRLAQVVGPEFAGVAVLLESARRELKRAGCPTESADWGSLLDDGLVTAVAAGRDVEARDRVKTWLERELDRIDDGTVGVRNRTPPLDLC